MVRALRILEVLEGELDDALERAVEVGELGACSLAPDELVDSDGGHLSVLTPLTEEADRI